MRWDRILMLAMGGFIALMIFFYVAFTSSRQSLVVDRPYEAALQHNTRLQAQANARLSGRRLEVSFQPANNQLVVQLLGCRRGAVAGQLHLLRPSDSRADRSYPLALDDSLRQLVPAADLQPGRWLLEAEWTEGDSLFYTQTAFYR